LGYKFRLRVLDPRDMNRFSQESIKMGPYDEDPYDIDSEELEDDFTEGGDYSLDDY